MGLSIVFSVNLCYTAKAMKKKRQSTGKIVNRRAKFDYELGDSFVFGIVLTGRETKSLRQGHAQLRGSYVVVKDGELWLINSVVSDGKTFTIEESEQSRSRKLLAHKKEINTLEQAKKQGYTIIPTEFLTRGKHIKVRVSLGKGKKHFDKRQDIKRRDLERETSRTFKRSK